ncbi:MAG: AAA family ATPase [Polyangiaceae bacterium]|nr:AAA family ATPase [Polyangiaceae bacterium]
MTTETSPELQATTEAGSHPRRWLERLKINQFRSVEPGTELHFSEGLHVVLGKNATGKSTLLDLVASALNLNFGHRAFRDEPLDLEFVLRAGPHQIDVAVKRAALTESSAVTLREEGRYTLRAPSGVEVTILLASDNPPRRIVKGAALALDAVDESIAWSFKQAPLAPNLPALGALLNADVRAISGNDQALHRMPESDELLKHIEGNSFEICLGESMWSRPGLLPDTIFRALPSDGSAIDISLVSEPLLAAFVREMGFSEARMYLGPPRVEQRYGSKSFVYSSPTFTFYRDGRLARRGDQLSYGQRRLFALGWYLVCNKEAAILDEPSNGLHESWIEFLVLQLRDRQVFLTSQNREMLDMLPFSTETELSRGFVLCESRPQPGGAEPTLHWRGLRDDESALMIKALRASRLDLVTDLLRALNLW